MDSFPGFTILSGSKMQKRRKKRFSIFSKNATQTVTSQQLRLQKLRLQRQQLQLHGLEETNNNAVLAIQQSSIQS